MMRHRRLLHRKGTLKVTHAHLAAAPNQDVKDGQSHWMTEELEIGAHPLQRVEIDARTPVGSTPRTPGSIGDFNDDTGRSFRHGDDTLKYIDGCQYVRVTRQGIVLSGLPTLDAGRWVLVVPDATTWDLAADDLASRAGQPVFLLASLPSSRERGTHSGSRSERLARLSPPPRCSDGRELVREGQNHRQPSARITAVERGQLRGSGSRIRLLRRFGAAARRSRSPLQPALGGRSR